RPARARRLLRSEERLLLDGGLMPNRLQGKVCVITGAGSGMGHDAAILFAEEGASVCVADVDLAAAEKTAAQCASAFAHRGDVADQASVKVRMDATPQPFG